MGVKEEFVGETRIEGSNPGRGSLILIFVVFYM